jgi:hypothetical protein
VTSKGGKFAGSQPVDDGQSIVVSPRLQGGPKVHYGLGDHEATALAVIDSLSPPVRDAALLEMQKNGESARRREEQTEVRNGRILMIGYGCGLAGQIVMLYFAYLLSMHMLTVESSAPYAAAPFSAACTACAALVWSWRRSEKSAKA